MLLILSVSKRVKLASRISASVRAGPMQAPRPGPPWASDWVVQCKVLMP